MPRIFVPSKYLKQTFETFLKRRCAPRANPTNTTPRAVPTITTPRAVPIITTPRAVPRAVPSFITTTVPLKRKRIEEHFPDISRNEKVRNFLPQARITPTKPYNAFAIGELPQDPITQFNRFNGCTECINIDPNYALELLKTISLLCPPLIYFIQPEKIMKVRWEHQQYDKAVEDLLDENVSRMEKWYPNTQVQKRALHFMICNITKEINDLIRTDFFTLTYYQREYYGAPNEFRFIDVISAASEVLECIKEANLTQNQYPIPLGHISEWIKGNKVLHSMFFKVAAFLFAIGDYRIGLRESAIELLKEVKKEKPKDNWVEMISDDEETTELSAIEVDEAIPPKEDEEGLIDIFITPEESQKIYDEFFYNPKKDKK